MPKVVCTYIGDAKKENLTVGVSVYCDNISAIRETFSFLSINNNNNNNNNNKVGLC